MHTPNRFAVEYNDLVALFHNETDRGAGVLAPAFLDQCLENCLRAFFVDDPFIKELFEENGPLATSFQKASMAFALGLITIEMREDLKYLRKIRNKFAHVPSVTSFETSPIRDWCSNLSMAKPIPSEVTGIF